MSIREKIDRALCKVIKKVLKPRISIERVERQVLPGRVRELVWCSAPEDARDEELLLVLRAIDKTYDGELTIWFCSKPEDIGRAPYDVAMLERERRGEPPTITRPRGARRGGEN